MAVHQARARHLAGQKAPTEESSSPLKLASDVVMVGDSIEIMRSLPAGSVDCIFADPPYNLQLGGELARPDGSLVDGVNHAWDRFETPEEYERFTSAWLAEAQRLLKPDGTLWVIGSYHCIYTIGHLLQRQGFWLLNDVVWAKTNPMPNFNGRRFQNATETLIWAARSKEAKPYFDHHAMKALNDGVQMRNVWDIPLCTGAERLLKKEGGKLHPTQKPEALLYRVLLSSTRPGDVLLDPFFGTGTSGAVAKRLGRRWIGLERDPHYAAAAHARIATTPARAVDGKLLAAGSARREKQVSVARLLEEGYLAPGALLRAASGRHEARLRADGQIIVARDGVPEITGSIHAVAAALDAAPTRNGWDYWEVDVAGDWRPLDRLRDLRAAKEQPSTPAVASRKRAMPASRHERAVA